MTLHRPVTGTTHGSTSVPTVFWWNSVGLVPVCAARSTHLAGVKRRPCFFISLVLRHPTGAPAGTR